MTLLMWREATKAGNGSKAGQSNTRTSDAILYPVHNTAPMMSSGFQFVVYGHLFLLTNLIRLRLDDHLHKTIYTFILVLRCAAEGTFLRSKAVSDQTAIKHW